MPYIPPTKRDVLNPHIDDLYHELVGLEADDPTNNMDGNINYVITRLLRMVYGRSYAEANAAIGMLECCKLEHYRTTIAPYEDEKIIENGDVKTGVKDIHLEEVLVKAVDKKAKRKKIIDELTG